MDTTAGYIQPLLTRWPGVNHMIICAAAPGGSDTNHGLSSSSLPLTSSSLYLPHGMLLFLLLRLPHGMRHKSYPVVFSSPLLLLIGCVLSAYGMHSLLSSSTYLMRCGCSSFERRFRKRSRPLWSEVGGGIFRERVIIMLGLWQFLLLLVLMLGEKIQLHRASKNSNRL